MYKSTSRGAREAGHVLKREKYFLPSCSIGWRKTLYTCLSLHLYDAGPPLSLCVSLNCTTKQMMTGERSQNYLGLYLGRLLLEMPFCILFSRLLSPI